MPNKTMPRHNMYIQGATQEKTNMFLQTPNLEVQIIEFTFTIDRFTDQAIKPNKTNTTPLISAIEEQG